MVDGAHAVEVFIHRTAADYIVVVRGLLDFFERDVHTALHFVFGVGASSAQAAFQLFDARRHDENCGDTAMEQFVVAGGLTHLCGALHIDVQQEVDAGCEFVLNFALERAVDMTVDLRVFVEIAGGYLRFKGGLVEKIVVDPVLLLPRGARVVEVTTRWMASSSVSTRSQTVVLPLPAGPETINRRPV